MYHETLLCNNAVCLVKRLKRRIYGLDSNGPYLSAPFGPVPFAPFGSGSPFAQPPFALPYSSNAPPPYAAPHPYPFPSWYPSYPYHNPVFAPPPPPLPPLFHPPVVAPAAPVGPPPAPIIVPAKTAAALSIASIIHGFITRKFYPPVLPIPIPRPVPYPLPERVKLRAKQLILVTMKKCFFFYFRLIYNISHLPTIWPRYESGTNTG